MTRLKGRQMSVQHFGSAHVPLSPAVRAGDFVYVSGQVPVDADGRIVDGGIVPETEQVIRNMQAVLEMAGCTLADVIKTHVYLKSAADFGAFNEVYGRYFSDRPPARTTAEANLMIDIKVEIEAIAYRPL